jgi:hypothetical protein
MPRIPTHEAGFGLPVAIRSGAGAGLQQLGGVGDALQQFAAQRLEQQRRQENVAWVSKTLAETRSGWTKKLLDAKMKAPAGAVGFSDGLIAQFDDQVKGALEAAPSPEARAIAEERMAIIRDDIWSNAATFEANETVRFRREQTGTNINLAAAAVRGDAGQFDNALMDTLAGIQALDIPAADKAELMEQARGTLATARYNALIDRNPAEAKKSLLAGAGAAYLTPAQSEALINNADVEIHRRQAEARAATAEAKALAMVDFRFRLEDDRARVARGEARTIGDAEIVAMMGEQAGARAIADLNGTQQAAIDVKGMALMTREEQDALIASYAPEGENFAGEASRQEQLRKTQEELQGQLAADRAAYVYAYSEPVQQAFAAAGESNKPEDWQKAIELSLQTQATVGVPEDQRRLLPEAQAKVVVERIKKAAPEQAADAVQDQAAAYGRYWPQVYGELVQAGLPSTYRVLATTDDPVARKSLAETLAVPQSELKKIAGDKAGRIEDAVDAALADFAGTQAFFPRGSQVYADYRDAVLGLAYKFGASADATAAAQQAAAIVNDRYDFVETETILARAPKGLGERATQTARYLLQTLKPADLADIGGVSPEARALTPEQRQDLYIENVRRGRWITNATDDGWLLLDEMGEPVRRADGQAVEFKFDAMPTFKTVGGRGGVVTVMEPAP